MNKIYEEALSIKNFLYNEVLLGDYDIPMMVATIGWEEESGFGFSFVDALRVLAIRGVNIGAAPQLPSTNEAMEAITREEDKVKISVHEFHTENDNHGKIITHMDEHFIHVDLKEKKITKITEPQNKW